MSASVLCSYRVYCLLGDGECSEGSVWEAMAFASYYKLDNLVAIMDVNRLGQSEAAPLGHDVETYRKRCEAFGSVPSVHLYCLVDSVDSSLGSNCQTQCLTLVPQPSITVKFGF